MSIFYILICAVGSYLVGYHSTSLVLEGWNEHDTWGVLFGVSVFLLGILCIGLWS